MMKFQKGKRIVALALAVLMVIGSLDTSVLTVSADQTGPAIDSYTFNEQGKSVDFQGYLTFNINAYDAAGDGIKAVQIYVTRDGKDWFGNYCKLNKGDSRFSFTYYNKTASGDASGDALSYASGDASGNASGTANDVYQVCYQIPEYVENTKLYVMALILYDGKGNARYVIDNEGKDFNAIQQYVTVGPASTGNFNYSFATTQTATTTISEDDTNSYDSLRDEYIGKVVDQLQVTGTDLDDYCNNGLRSISALFEYQNTDAPIDDSKGNRDLSIRIMVPGEIQQQADGTYLASFDLRANPRYLEGTYKLKHLIIQPTSGGERYYVPGEAVSFDIEKKYSDTAAPTLESIHFYDENDKCVDGKTITSGEKIRVELALSNAEDLWDGKNSQNPSDHNYLDLRSAIGSDGQAYYSSVALTLKENNKGVDNVGEDIKGNVVLSGIIDTSSTCFNSGFRTGTAYLNSEWVVAVSQIFDTSGNRLDVTAQPGYYATRMPYFYIENSEKEVQQAAREVMVTVQVPNEVSESGDAFCDYTGNLKITSRSTIADVLNAVGIHFPASYASGKLAGYVLNGENRVVYDEDQTLSILSDDWSDLHISPVYNDMTVPVHMYYLAEPEPGKYETRYETVMLPGVNSTDTLEDLRDTMRNYLTKYPTVLSLANLSKTYVMNGWETDPDGTSASSASPLLNYNSYDLYAAYNTLPVTIQYHYIDVNGTIQHGETVLANQTVGQAPNFSSVSGLSTGTSTSFISTFGSPQYGGTLNLRDRVADFFFEDSNGNHPVKAVVSYGNACKDFWEISGQMISIPETYNGVTVQNLAYWDERQYTWENLPYDPNTKNYVLATNTSMTILYIQPERVLSMGVASNPVWMDSNSYNKIIQDIKNALDNGDTSIKVSMRNATGDIINNIDKTMLANITQLIRGKNFTVIFDLETYTWSINGNDVLANNWTDISFEVLPESAIVPQNIVNNLVQGRPSMQLTLSHEGNFGFRGTLHIYVGKEFAGKYCNLYYYQTDGKTEFMQASLVDTDGYTDVVFNHASDYVLIFDDKADEVKENEDANGGESGNTSSGGSASSSGGSSSGAGSKKNSQKTEDSKKADASNKVEMEAVEKVDEVAYVDPFSTSVKEVEASTDIKDEASAANEKLQLDSNEEKSNVAADRTPIEEEDVALSATVETSSFPFRYYVVALIVFIVLGGACIFLFMRNEKKESK